MKSSAVDSQASSGPFLEPQSADARAEEWWVKKKFYAVYERVCVWARVCVCFTKSIGGTQRKVAILSSEKQELENKLVSANEQNANTRKDLDEVRKQLSDAQKETAQKVNELSEVKKQLQSLQEAQTPSGVQALIQKSLTSDDPFTDVWEKMSEKNRSLNGLLADCERDKLEQTSLLDDAKSVQDQLGTELQSAHTQLTHLSDTLAEKAKFEGTLVQVIQKLITENKALVHRLRELQEEHHRLSAIKDSTQRMRRATSGPYLVEAAAPRPASQE